MRAYYNMPTSDFVDQLRDIAIKANARAQVIDCIDDIVDGPTEDEIEKQCEEARAEGIGEGRSSCLRKWRKERMWVLRDLDSTDIGLTETQLEQVLECIDRMEPEA